MGQEACRLICWNERWVQMQLILPFHERSLCERSLWSILGSSWMQLHKHMLFVAHYKPNCDTYCIRAFLKHSHVGWWKCGRPFHERGFYMIHIASRMNNLCLMIKIIWFFFAFFFLTKWWISLCHFPACISSYWAHRCPYYPFFSLPPTQTTYNSSKHAFHKQEW